jgi:hypothetical protein
MLHLNETESSILDVLDHRLWTGSDIEEALRVKTFEERIEMYSSIGLLRRKRLLEEYPSSISGRVYMITMTGMNVRRECRQQQLQLYVTGRTA